jgi:hypothetical protein
MQHSIQHDAWPHDRKRAANVICSGSLRKKRIDHGSEAWRVRWALVDQRSHQSVESSVLVYFKHEVRSMNSCAQTICPALRLRVIAALGATSGLKACIGRDRPSSLRAPSSRGWLPIQLRHRGPAPLPRLVAHSGHDATRQQ